MSLPYFHSDFARRLAFQISDAVFIRDEKFDASYPALNWFWVEGVRIRPESNQLLDVLIVNQSAEGRFEKWVPEEDLIHKDEVMKAQLFRHKTQARDAK